MKTSPAFKTTKYNKVKTAICSNITNEKGTKVLISA